MKETISSPPQATPHKYHRTAILYLTHYLDEQLIFQLTKLTRNLAPTQAPTSCHSYHLILLYENSRNNFREHLKTYPILNNITTWIFTPADIQAYYPAMQGKYNRSGKDQACSFIQWAMQQANSDSDPDQDPDPDQDSDQDSDQIQLYDFYWCLEYDVRFYGDWTTLFRHYENIFYDILANDLGSRHEGWNHWKGLTKPKYRRKRFQTALFMPIIRYTRRALELLDQQYRLGNVGHCEAIQSCIMKDFGYSMKQIKANYIGYFHFRPALSSRRYLKIRRRNKLYHPVKSKL